MCGVQGWFIPFHCASHGSLGMHNLVPPCYKFNSKSKVERNNLIEIYTCTCILKRKVRSIGHRPAQKTDHKKIPKRISKTYLDVHKSSFCQLKNKGHKLLGTTPISNKYPYWYQRLTSALVRRIKGVDLQIAT